MPKKNRIKIWFSFVFLCLLVLFGSSLKVNAAAPNITAFYDNWEIYEGFRVDPSGGTYLWIDSGYLPEIFDNNSGGACTLMTFHDSSHNVVGFIGVDLTPENTFTLYIEYSSPFTQYSLCTAVYVSGDNWTHTWYEGDYSFPVNSTHIHLSNDAVNYHWNLRFLYLVNYDYYSLCDSHYDVGSSDGFTPAYNAGYAAGIAEVYPPGDEQLLLMVGNILGSFWAFVVDIADVEVWGITPWMIVSTVASFALIWFILKALLRG